MRNPFRDPYVTWHAGAESPHAEDASPSDPLRVVWAARTDRNGDRVGPGNPVKVNDPDFVHERIPLPTIHLGRREITFAPMDVAVWASVGSLLLAVGALFGASV